MSKPSIVPAEKLIEFGKQVFQKVGVPEKDARTVAEVLVQSNLRGVDTHGIFLVRLYSQRIEKGLINTKPNMNFEKKRAAVGVLDADTGFGQLSTLKAMDHAMEMARECGTGTVMVKCATHFGAGAYYTNYAAQKNMIGILMAHSEKDVVLFGGKKPYLGTNPYSVAIPAGKRRPFLMDMATSEVAFGKVRAAAHAGETIPPTWAVDSEGNPVTDARKAHAVTPMSGAKGYAISLMIELLSSSLTGMAYGPGIVPKFDDFEHPQQLGYFVQAIDPSAYTDLQTFKDRVDAVLNDIAAQPPLPSNPFGRILIPGEPEFEKTEKNLAEGCTVSPTVSDQMREVGEKYGVEWPG
jgi:ureidoglycolate dehydrogenase (NAD+)